MDTFGKSLPRKDALDKVTGRAKYIDDYTREDLLYGATVRSTEPHAEIISIDTTEARKIDGVVGIFTAKDIPGKNIVPLVLPDYPFLADKVVKFHGQAIALVVAKDRRTAKKAAAAVKIKYKKLPAVFDAREALNKNSPKIYGEDNIFKKFVVKKGNPDDAFKKCEVVISGSYSVNYQVHAYLETQGMLAEPTDTGIVVYG